MCNVSDNNAHPMFEHKKLGRYLALSSLALQMTRFTGFVWQDTGRRRPRACTIEGKFTIIYCTIYFMLASI